MRSRSAKHRLPVRRPAKEHKMSLLIINAIFFTQRWREAVTAGQSDHRFHSHTKEERERFDRMLRRRRASRPLRNQP
jgi:serine protease inhibitor